MGTNLPPNASWKSGHLAMRVHDDEEAQLKLF